MGLVYQIVKESSWLSKKNSLMSAALRLVGRYELEEEDLIAEDIVVTVTHRGYISAYQLMLTVLSAGVGGVLLSHTKSDDFVNSCLASNHRQSCSLPTAAESPAAGHDSGASRSAGNSDINLLSLDPGDAFRLPIAGEDQYLQWLLAKA